MKFPRSILIAATLSAAQSATATPLLTNGGFETGDFTGWTVTDLANGSGTWSVASGTTTPISGHPTVGAASGNFYAVTDQGGPGTHALTQNFIVPIGATSVVLSFDMFANNQAGGAAIINPVGLDHTQGPNQHARVDLLSGSATAFDTGVGVLDNLFIGADSGANPNGYTPYIFDITSFISPGGTFQIRFAESDNQLFFNQGVDNVSVEARIGASVPEPTTLALLGLGIAGVGFNRRKQLI